MDTPSPLTALSDAEQERVLSRFYIIRTHLEDGVPLVLIARAHGATPRTLERWVVRYRREGLAGLARRSRADKGRHRMPLQLQQLIEGLALGRPRLGIAAIRRQAVEVAARQRLPEPSYKQVRAIVRAIDPALVSLAHDGAKSYGRNYDLVRRREANRPNEVWQADHTQLDIWLLDDRGQPSRPWLTAILDDHSRAVPGYYLTFSAPSAIGTALALHQAIWRKADARWQVCGIPDTFYTDHGPDFTSRHIEQVAADIGIVLVYSQAGEPRGRGKIERFFGTVNQMLLPDLPGYAPEGSKAPKPVLTLAELDAYFRSWLVDTYHRRVHGETKQAPAERWEADGFLPRMPDSLEQLDLLLLTVAKTRRVHPDGIHFQGYRYLVMWTDSLRSCRSA